MPVARACGDGVKRSVATHAISSPIGMMMLTTCGRGLHMIFQSPDINDTNFSPDCRMDVELLDKVDKDTAGGNHVHDAVDWLRSYFHDLKNIGTHTLPKMCCIDETGLFHDKVLLTLFRNVPPGEVVSYSALAKLAGSPGAQQSVGTAMAKNPFQLMIPCHRVVKSGNIVGKYSSGCRNSVKIWLLQHEGLIVSKDGTVSSV